MKNNITFTPYLKKKYSTDKEGIINIRITENRKSKYFSLKLKIKEKDWNSNKNEVRNSCKEYELFSKIIKEKLEELKEIHKQVDSVDKVKENDLSSVLSFYKNEVDLLFQQKKFGTSKKMNTTLTHFTNFLISIGLNDIKFKDINVNFVERYEIYLSNQGISINTIKKYVSIFGKIYNLSVKKQVFIPKSDPFILFQNTRVSVEKKRLSKIEVETIINQNIDKKSLLYKIKNYFLFQIFCQGIRVSDLLTLRWGNIVDGRIEFYQYKTKKKHSVLINDNLVFIIVEFMKVDCNDILNHTFSFKIDKEYRMSFNEIKSKYNEIKKEHITGCINGDKNSIEIVESWKNQLNEIRFKVVINLSIRINQYSKQNENKFIVELLNDDDFKEIVFDGNPVLSQFQYNQISSKTTIYNKQLKELQFLCKIKTKLSSHITRHTYTNLLIENTDNDIYSISKSLGHQRLSTTEHYINDFNTTRTDKVNQEMNNLFML